MANKKAAPAAIRKEASVNTFIAVAVAVTVVVVVVCLIAANALSRSIILNGKAMAAQNKAMGQLKTKLDNAPQLVSAYHQLGSQADLVQHALPTSPDFAQLITIASSMAVASGVQLKSVTPANTNNTSGGTAPAATPSPSPTSASAASSAATSPSSTASGVTSGSVSGPSQYQFSVEVNGTYPQIISFLQAIEHSARPIQVSTANFSGNGGALDTTLTFTTYYQAEASVTDKTEVIK